MFGWRNKRALVLCLAALAGLVASLAACAAEAEVAPEEQIRIWEECAVTDIDPTESEARQEYYEKVRAVKNKHKERFKRLPNYVSVGVGRMATGQGEELARQREAYGSTVGISVGVLEPVDWSKVPEEDRLGDCLDGVPVKVFVTELPQPLTLD